MTLLRINRMTSSFVSRSQAPQTRALLESSIHLCSTGDYQALTRSLPCAHLDDRPGSTHTMTNASGGVLESSIQTSESVRASLCSFGAHRSSCRRAGGNDVFEARSLESL